MKSDANELTHFQNLSSHWWDESGPFAQLHAINPLRIAFLKDKAGVHFRRSDHNLKPLQGLRILDVGCGGGLLCEPLTRLGAEVTGIDLIPENINVAKTHAKEMGLSITYMLSTIEDLSQDLPLFDIVIASEVIEHITDHSGFLERCVNRLKPHGAMMVTTFNKTLQSYLFGILTAEYVLRWAPRGTHSWDKFRSPQELSKILFFPWSWRARNDGPMLFAYPWVEIVFLDQGELLSLDMQVKEYHDKNTSPSHPK